MPHGSSSRLGILAGALLVIAVLGARCRRLPVLRGLRLLRPAGNGRAPAIEPVRPGLPPGAYLSDFALPALADDGAPGGPPRTLSGLAGRPVLLAFLQPGCPASRALARELARHPQPDEAPMLVVVVVGEVAGGQDLRPFAGLSGVVLRDPHGETMRLARANATPTGYLVDGERRTVGPMLRGPAALLRALRGCQPWRNPLPRRR